MAFLLVQIFTCLIGAALIGAVTAWLLRRRIARRREAIMQNDWRERLRQLEADRDRTVRRLSDNIAALEAAAASGGDVAAASEYDELITRLEERVTEREGVIGELRDEIRELRAGLGAAAASAREREAASVEQVDRRSLEKAQDDARAEAAEAALAQRDERIRTLEAELEAAQAAAREQRRELAEFRAATAEQPHGRPDEVAERDAQRIAERDAQRIAELEAAVRQRDDSIAVLRDDLARFADQPAGDARGRQDDQLRAAMEEALAWEQKHAIAQDAVAERDARIARLENRLAAHGDPGQTRARRRGAVRSSGPARRSAGERIGAVLAGATVDRDDLREIRGIGPALERMLNELGVYRFRQIAELDDEGIERIAREIGRFGDRIRRDDWVGQARRLAGGSGADD